MCPPAAADESNKEERNEAAWPVQAGGWGWGESSAPCARRPMNAKAAKAACPSEPCFLMALLALFTFSSDVTCSRRASRVRGTSRNSTREQILWFSSSNLKTHSQLKNYSLRPYPYSPSISNIKSMFQFTITIKFFSSLLFSTLNASFLLSFGAHILLLFFFPEALSNYRPDSVLIPRRHHSRQTQRKMKIDQIENNSKWCVFNTCSIMLFSYFGKNF